MGDMLAELERLVSAAEKAAESVHDKAEPLTKDREFSEAEIVKIAQEVEEGGKVAMAACSACADFLAQKRSVIEEAAAIKAEAATAIQKASPRIQAATRQATEALQKAKQHKEQIGRKMAAERIAKKRQQLFDKYDVDKDGLLNREEVAAYAKGEFSFELPEENLDRIARQLFHVNADGVEPKTFQLLKSAVGIARNE